MSQKMCRFKQLESGKKAMYICWDIEISGILKLDFYTKIRAKIYIGKQKKGKYDSTRNSLIHRNFQKQCSTLPNVDFYFCKCFKCKENRKCLTRVER